MKISLVDFVIIKESKWAYLQKSETFHHMCAMSLHVFGHPWYIHFDVTTKKKLHHKHNKAYLCFFSDKVYTFTAKYKMHHITDRHLR